MQLPQSFRPNRLGALIATIAFSGAVLAQSADGVPISPPTAPAYDQTLNNPSYGNTESRPNGRGLFAVTIAALIAQGIGNGIGSGLAQGLGGTILKWFTGDPEKNARETEAANRSSTDLAAATPTPASAADPSAAAVPAQAGIAYEIHLIERNGRTRAVDPEQHAFRTGDQFVVYYRPTLPGRVRVLNTNAQGRETQIDTAEIAAGALASLGPYQFVGAKGDESLKIVTESCSRPTLTVATRDLVKVASNRPAALALADCDDARTRGMRRHTRSIRKTTTDGATAFALDPLRREELASGLIEPREITIRLRHR